jgi:hypothetical protein
MGTLLGIVLPLGVGAAVSPAALTVQLLTLSRKQSPLARAWTLTAGFALMLAIYAALAFALAKSTGGSHSSSEAGAIVKLIAAALLAGLGVRTLRKAPAPAKPEHVGSHPLRSAFLLGVLLMATNFSSIVLFFPAVHAIGVAKVSVSGKVLAFVLLYALTLVPAAGPPLAVTMLGSRATPILERLNRFFTTHRRGIAVGICFAFALLLALAGVKELP